VFDTVTHVVAINPDERVMQHIGNLDTTELLYIQSRSPDSRLTPAGWSLEELFVNGRNVTNKGFAHVARLTKLKPLVLNGATISDLSPLGGLSGRSAGDRSDKMNSSDVFTRIEQFSRIANHGHDSAQTKYPRDGENTFRAAHRSSSPTRMWRL
jgi:hypothetical protein